MARPQFGDPDPSRRYSDRPAAFGIAEAEGRIALVRVQKPGHPAWRDLPGGAIDPGETAEDAVIREFGEETGLRVSVVEGYAEAGQYFINTDGQAFNNLGAFFVLRIEGEDGLLKIEDDHTLEWAEPQAALAALRHDAHAWAVASWLRRLRRPSRGASRRP